MILENLNILGRTGLEHIQLKGDKIDSISPDISSLKTNGEELPIVFDNVIAFPGLINSHDHLEFNLFPKLGNAVYKNYLEWGADIFKQNKDTISEIVKIPKQLRVEWGIIKNLINGVTTVVHHGEYFNIEKPVINVFQDCHSLHSVRLEKNWKLKLNKLLTTDKPFAIHLGEGTDPSCVNEINELIKWNLFKRKIIAIHGISMTEKQAESFEALIWCPDSNYFLYNATANINLLKEKIKILFGTDSAVSADWNLWDQLRLARSTKQLSDEELIKSLTTWPAAVWKLENKATLTEGKIADIVVANKKNRNSAIESFFQLNPADILLVLNKGEIIYFDQTLFSQINEYINTEEFSMIYVNNAVKYIKADIGNLVKEIKKSSPAVKFPVETDLSVNT